MAELTEELWIEIQDRLAPILGDVSVKSVRSAMKKTKTPQLHPGRVTGFALCPLSGNVVLVALDDGGNLRCKPIGIPPLTIGERIMVLFMPPNAAYCFSTFGYPQNGINICTDTTRPVNPFNGMMVFEENTTKTMQYSAAGAEWRCIARLNGSDPFNPAPRIGTTYITEGASVIDAHYNQIGQYVDAVFTATWSGASAGGATGYLVFNLPFAPVESQAVNPFPTLGHAAFLNTGVGRTTRLVVQYTDMAATVAAFSDMAFGSALVSNSSPYTWNTDGNALTAKMRYRCDV